ncbi:MAG: hypothetical protein OXI16_00370, partial [Chloroflexota bacterium]|nr:hypothetical protein [Chloroflexota bacterium]
MLRRIKTMTRRRAYGIAGAAVALFAVGAMFYTGFATDVALGLLNKIPSGGMSAHPGCWGPTSLEERILSSDVIARVRLKAM